MKTIGERLEYVRREKGLSNQSMADLLESDITGDAIRKGIRRDKVRTVYVRILSDKLGINRDWLETGEGEMVLKDGLTVNEPQDAYGDSLTSDYQKSITLLDRGDLSTDEVFFVKSTLKQFASFREGALIKIERARDLFT